MRVGMIEKGREEGIRGGRGKDGEGERRRGEREKEGEGRMERGRGGRAEAVDKVTFYPSQVIQQHARPIMAGKKNMR